MREGEVWTLLASDPVIWWGWDRIDPNGRRTWSEGVDA